MSRADEAARQAALVRALVQVQAPGQAGPPGQDLPPGLRGLAGVAGGAARGLQAYRGNAKALAQRSLAAAFPRLYAQLGEAEFASMAWAFWRRHPPHCGELGRWGQALPDFLAAQPDMDPALPDGARIEWARHEAEQAADAELDAGSLAALTRQDPVRLRLLLRPGLTLLRVGRAAAEPWLADLPARDSPVELLVWRRAWKAELGAPPPDWCFFMRDLLAGLNLQQALDRCLAVHPDFDLAAWLPAALGQGWLQAVLTLTEDAR